MSMSDREFEFAIKLRCGLPPTDSPLPSICPLCSTAMIDAYHFFSCVKLKRRSLNSRHDSAQNGLAHFARSNSCIVTITLKRADSKVPDGRIVMSERAVQVDVSGTHPLSASIEPKVRGRPGHALVLRENYKIGGYRTYAESQGDEFAPVAIESFGGIGTQALILVKQIEEEGAYVDVSPHRMSSRWFVAWLSVNWQKHNLRAFAEWRRLIHERRGHS